MNIVRSDEEVGNLLNDVQDAVDEGTSRYPGMSYEQGVEAAIRWLIGQTDDHPYDEEDESGEDDEDEEDDEEEEDEEEAAKDTGGEG